MFCVWITVAVAIFVRATRSGLITTPTYRVLFLLVVVGVLVICMVPEAAFVLPTLHAIGLDVVTILAALELRHYILPLARLIGVPKSVSGLRHGLAPWVSRGVGFLIAPTNPKLWPYACMLLITVFHAVMASMKVSPPTQG